MNFRRMVAGIVLVLGTGGGICKAQEITVAAAADLQFVMQDIAARFQKETGKSVKLIYGSSGNFFQQVQNGAPFDMFFSANLDYPRKLEAAELTEPGTLYRYAMGKIVIWVPNDSKVDVSSGLQSLLNPAIRKIAIANPQHAPYGQAAVAAMRKQNIYDKVADKFVLGENISQTASFVVSRSADAGIVALSRSISQHEGQRSLYGNSRRRLPVDPTSLCDPQVFAAERHSESVPQLHQDPRSRRALSSLRFCRAE